MSKYVLGALHMLVHIYCFKFIDLLLKNNGNFYKKNAAPIFVRFAINVKTLIGLEILFINMEFNFSTRDVNALQTVQTQCISAAAVVSSKQGSEWSSCFWRTSVHCPGTWPVSWSTTGKLFLSLYHSRTCTCLLSSLSGWKISFPLLSGQTRVQ